MNKQTYNHILDQIQGIEILMVMVGVKQIFIDALLKILAQEKYNDHRQYLICLAEGLKKIAEEFEHYEICSTLQKLIDKINGK